MKAYNPASAYPSLLEMGSVVAEGWEDPCSVDRVSLSLGWDLRSGIDWIFWSLRTHRFEECLCRNLPSPPFPLNEIGENNVVLGRDRINRSFVLHALIPISRLLPDRWFLLLA